MKYDTHHPSMAAEQPHKRQFSPEKNSMMARFWRINRAFVSNCQRKPIWQVDVGCQRNWRRGPGSNRRIKVLQTSPAN
jgi:hypothetical protein